MPLIEQRPEVSRRRGIPPRGDIFDRYNSQVARAAFELHLLRFMTAPEDPYQAEVLAGVPVNELWERDWAHAAGMVSQNLPGVLDLLHEKYQTYLEKSTKKQAA